MNVNEIFVELRSFGNTVTGAWGSGGGDGVGEMSLSENPRGRALYLFSRKYAGGARGSGSDMKVQEVAHMLSTFLV